MDKKTEELKEELNKRAVSERCNGDDAQKMRNDLRQRIKNKQVVLLIGAGITSGLVGNWKELLNELAILRCGSWAIQNKKVGYGIPTLPQLRDFLQGVKDRSFLPVDTNVLEQGEYLMYDPKDPEAQRIHKRKESDERWREQFFAAQVRDAMKHLTKKHLCDASGKGQKELEEDFIDWCLNRKDHDFFGVPRRKISDDEDVSKYLVLKRKSGKITTDDLVRRLNERYNTNIDLVDLDTLVKEVKKGVTGKEELLAEKIHIQLRDLKKIIKKEDWDAFDILAKKAADTIWRPNYGTLYSLLKLCVTGAINEVITYNFDTIFDHLLINPKIQKILGAKSLCPVQVYSIHNEKPVNLPGAVTEKDDHNAIRIYHVHGILDDSLPVQPIIFSEYSYQTYQNRIMNWSNIRIAELVNTSDLLCVGFSGTDANFRNLVRLCRELQTSPIFANEKKLHTVFLMRSCEGDIDRFLMYRDLSIQEVMECTCWCLDTYFELVQTYYQKQLGISVIWSKNFTEMAGQLADLA